MIRHVATICQVLHSLNVGGAEVLAYRLAKQLGDRYRFVFACLDDLGPLGDELSREGFRVEVLERRPGFDHGCARRLARFARAQRAGLIHAHQYTPFFYALCPARYGPRAPVLLTEHGRWFPDYPRRKRMIFNRLFLRGKDRVVGVGRAVRRALIENEGIPEGRVGVIYNGVDLSKYAAGAADRSAVRAQLGLDEGNYVIVQVARLDALKDHATAIRTLARVATRWDSVRLLLVGEGPEQARIEAEMARLQLQGTVQLLGLRTDVERILAAADLFLLTSISEGIPVTLIEAMGLGLPIVATDVGGVSEVVVDGSTGLLASAGDDAGLAESILRLIQDPQSAASLGACGRRRAEQLFAEPQMHAAYARLYEEMLFQRQAGKG